METPMIKKLRISYLDELRNIPSQIVNAEKTLVKRIRCNYRVKFI